MMIQFIALNCCTLSFW